MESGFVKLKFIFYEISHCRHTIIRRIEGRNSQDVQRDFEDSSVCTLALWRGVVVIMTQKCIYIGFWLFLHIPRLD